MKITICGSMAFASEMLDYQQKLEALGHVVIIPSNTEECVEINMDQEGVNQKIELDVIRAHFQKIKKSDAILVLNFDKNGVKNYIGGNAFLEMGFAHVLGKKIYLINPLPEISYLDEMQAMGAEVLWKITDL